MGAAKAKTTVWKRANAETSVNFILGFEKKRENGSSAVTYAKDVMHAVHCLNESSSIQRKMFVIQ